jgi:hypothetical protein
MLFPEKPRSISPESDDPENERSVLLESTDPVIIPISSQLPQELSQENCVQVHPMIVPEVVHGSCIGIVGSVEISLFSFSLTGEDSFFAILFAHMIFPLGQMI